MPIFSLVQIERHEVWVFRDVFCIFVTATIRMRPFTFLLACGLWLSACTSNPWRTLDEAERLLSSHPDSSLHIIQRIPEKSLATRRLRARRNLLLTAALDKNNDIILDDELISSAYFFYRRRGPGKDRLRSSYYWAVVKQYMGETTEATYLFNEAERISEILGDNHYLGLSREHLCALHAGNYDVQSAFEYAQKAAIAFDNAGEKLSADFSRVDVARQSYNLGQRERAIEMADSLLACNMGSDSGLRYTLLVLKADILFWDREYKQASNLYEQAMSLGYPLGLLGIGHMAIIKEAEGQHAAADSCMQVLFQQMVSPNDSAIYHSSKQTILQLRREYKDAYEASEKARKLQNDVVMSELSRSLTHSQKVYFEECYIMENARNRTLFIWFILISALLSSFILIVYLSLQKRKKQVIDGMEEIENLSRSLSLLKTKHKGAQATLYAMVQDRIYVMQDLANKYSSWVEDVPTIRGGVRRRLQKEEIINEFRLALNSLRKDHQFISEIENALNLNYQDIIFRLRATFSANAKHKMNDRDFNLLILLFAGFPPKCAALILNMSEESVRMRKSRYKKLFISMGEAGADFAERLS